MESINYQTFLSAFLSPATPNHHKTNVAGVPQPRPPGPHPRHQRRQTAGPRPEGRAGTRSANPSDNPLVLLKTGSETPRWAGPGWCQRRVPSVSPAAPSSWPPAACPRRRPCCRTAAGSEGQKTKLGLGGPARPLGGHLCLLSYPNVHSG